MNSKILSSKRGKTEIIDKKGGSRGREYFASHDKIPRNEEHDKIIVRIAPSSPHFFIMKQNMAKWWCDVCVFKGAHK